MRKWIFSACCCLLVLALFFLLLFPNLVAMFGNVCKKNNNRSSVSVSIGISHSNTNNNNNSENNNNSNNNSKKKKKNNNNNKNNIVSANGNRISGTVNTSLAILVPYRNRANNLALFLGYLHPFLKQQQQNLTYKIYVINQSNDGRLFNRGMLFNVGFVMAMEEKKWNCIINHDVDLIPENPNNIYECWDQPRHMNVASSKYNYTNIGDSYMGGVVALTPEQYMKTNGYSNLFFGWGGEDDDFGARIENAGMIIKRSNSTIGRYLALAHENQTVNEVRKQLVITGKDRFSTDGLNSLKYKLLEVKQEQTMSYTNISVKLL